MYHYHTVYGDDNDYDDYIVVDTELEAIVSYARMVYNSENLEGIVILEISCEKRDGYWNPFHNSSAAIKVCVKREIPLHTLIELVSRNYDTSSLDKIVYTLQ